MRITFYRTGQACGLALVMLICSTLSALSHGVPGSVLILSRDETQLDVDVQIALEDLMIAAPAFAGWQDMRAPKDLSETDLSMLADYFSTHFQIASRGTDLRLTLTEAALRSVSHHDVGTYTLLTARFAAAIASSSKTFPLSLSYTAIMHEIRSHSATVYFQQAGQPLRGIAQFRYQNIDGTPPPVLLKSP